MKKNLLIPIFCLLIGQILANENETKVNSTIQEVIVFTKGAQIKRTAKSSIKVGTNELKFTGLSPHIHKNSVQIKAKGDFTILSIVHQLNYLEQLDITPEVEKLTAEKVALEEKIEEEQTMLTVFQQEEKLLLANQSIGGEAQGLQVAELQKAAEFHRSRMADIKKNILTINRSIKKLKADIAKILSQIQEMTGNRKKTATGEVVVTILSKVKTMGDFELSYVVGRAGWYPQYDIRVKDVENPIDLIYKANVFQNTGEDWKNVQLTLSTGDPSLSGTKPQLYPWRLTYYNPNLAYYNRSNFQRLDNYNYNLNGVVRGRILDSTGEPLIGASILVKGTSTGTVTDIDGSYSLNLPSGAKEIVISYTGYSTQEVNIGDGGQFDIRLDESGTNLTEVVVIGAKRKSKKDRKNNYTAVPTQTIENTTSVAFKIEIPYSIPSDGKKYLVDINEHEIPAYYEYYCAPKLDKDAFLTAQLTGWEQYNLLDGEANLFFEGTYIGKSLLNVQNVNDTLAISLGRDKNIVVTRTKKTDFTDKQLIGNKKTERRAWEIEVRNKKQQSINLVLQDQFPISTNDDIEVKYENYKGAALDETTGILTWTLNIPSNQSEKLEFQYGVKYPKKRAVRLE